MGLCVNRAGKGAYALRKKRIWLVLLAVLALVALSGCTQPKQVGSQCMPSTAQLVAEITPDVEVSTNDQNLRSGTAAAANYVIRNRYNPGSGEEVGPLSQEMRTVSETERYNSLSAPSTPNAVEMSRTFVYPGDWSEGDVAHAISMVIQQMDTQLPTDNKNRQFNPDSYLSYTYDYSVSVYQIYGDRNTAWIIGVGVTQTAKEEHKT